MSGGDLLTPKTVSINPVTNFDYASSVRPDSVLYIYFLFTRGNFSGVREFTVEASTDNYDSAEITENVPRYILSNLSLLKGTTAEDVIIAVSKDDTKTLYVYNYFWSNNQKVLSSWSKFTFDNDIGERSFVDSTLYLLTTNNGESYLETLPLESGQKDDAGFITYLDQRIEDTVLSGANTITLPYTPDSSDTIEVYTKDGLKLSCTQDGTGTVTLDKAVKVDTDVWVGRQYTMLYTFNELMFKAAAGQQARTPSAATKMRYATEPCSLTTLLTSRYPSRLCIETPTRIPSL